MSNGSFDPHFEFSAPQFVDFTQSRSTCTGGHSSDFPDFDEDEEAKWQRDGEDSLNCCQFEVEEEELLLVNSYAVDTNTD